MYPAANQDSYSDSELCDSDISLSLKRHSHFFLPPPLAGTRARPRSVPLLSPDRAASPMMTVLDDSSSERIDRVSDGTTEGGRETEDGGAADKDGGIRLVYVARLQFSEVCNSQRRCARVSGRSCLVCV